MCMNGEYLCYLHTVQVCVSFCHEIVSDILIPKFN